MKEHVRLRVGVMRTWTPFYIMRRSTHYMHRLISSVSPTSGHPVRSKGGMTHVQINEIPQLDWTLVGRPRGTMETGRIVRLTVTCLSPHRNTALNSPAPQIDHLDLLFLLTSSHPTQGPDSSLDVGGTRRVGLHMQSLVGPAWGTGTGNSTFMALNRYQTHGRILPHTAPPLRVLGKFV